jgi:hypothetical protein
MHGVISVIEPVASVTIGNAASEITGTIAGRKPDDEVTTLQVGGALARTFGGAVVASGGKSGQNDRA